MSDQVPNWDFMDSIDDDEEEEEEDGPSQPPPPPRLGVSHAGGGQLVDLVHSNSASHPILTWHQAPCSSLIVGEETIYYDHTSPSAIFTSFSNSQYQEPPPAICHDHHQFQLGQKGESSCSQVQSGTTQTQHPDQTQTQVTNSCVAELSTGIPGHGKRPKRTRSAETHNRSERRRRDRIRGKMKALQELIPNCNKSNRAAMLDEAVEYLKFLKYQVQVMATGGGILLQPPFHMSPAAQYQSTQIPQYTPTLSTWRPRRQTMGLPFPSPNLYPSPSAGNFVPPGFPHVQVPLNPLQPYPERTSVQPALIPTFSFSSQLGDSTSQTLPTMSNDRFTAHIQAMTQEYVTRFTTLQPMGGLVRTTSSSDSTVAELPRCEKEKKRNRDVQGT